MKNHLKINKRKLALSAETLRELTAEQTGLVAGGMSGFTPLPTFYRCAPETFQCHSDTCP